jgi:uncharacterized protein YegP (UPF0339 family)
MKSKGHVERDTVRQMANSQFYFQLRQDPKKQWRWSFYRANGHHLAVSAESYDTEDACRDAIAELMNHVPSARVRFGRI